MTRPTRPHPAKNGPEQEPSPTNMSRRNFLHLAGGATAGGLAVTAGTGLLADRDANAQDTPKAPPLPWKYAKLDPLEAGKRGYENYLLNGG